MEQKKEVRYRVDGVGPSLPALGVLPLSGFEQMPVKTHHCPLAVPLCAQVRTAAATEESESGLCLLRIGRATPFFPGFKVALAPLSF